MKIRSTKRGWSIQVDTEELASIYCSVITATNTRTLVMRKPNTPTEDRLHREFSQFVEKTKAESAAFQARQKGTQC